MTLHIDDNTDKVIAQLGLAMTRALEAIGIEAEGDASEICPVDTGRLRDSITHAIDSGNKRAVIGTNVEYALYVHEGTSRMHGQPFLTDAVTKNADKYKRIVESQLKGS